MSAASAGSPGTAATHSSMPQQPLPASRSAPSITPLSLSHSVDAAPDSTLTKFIQRTKVQERYTAAAAAYERACDELQCARAEQAKFIAACNKHAPAVHLPSSLQLKLLKNAKLAPVTTDAAFYSAQIAELTQIEREASERIYQVLLAAKEKHVEHLQSQANAQAFIARSTEEYRLFVTTFAADYNMQFGFASPPAAEPTAAASHAAADAHAAAFPTALIVKHFEQTLTSHITSYVLLSVEHRQTRAAHKLQAMVEESKAQEQVIGGAHSGATITSLAQREVAKQLMPLQKQVHQLQHQRSQQVLQPHAVRSSESHKSATSGRATHRSHGGHTVSFNGQHPSTSHQPRSRSLSPAQQRRSDRQATHGRTREDHTPAKRPRLDQRHADDQHVQYIDTSRPGFTSDRDHDDSHTRAQAPPFKGDAHQSKKRPRYDQRNSHDGTPVKAEPVGTRPGGNHHERVRDRDDRDDRRLQSTHDQVNHTSNTHREADNRTSFQRSHTQHRPKNGEGGDRPILQQTHSHYRRNNRGRGRG